MPPQPRLINTFRCNQRWDDMQPTPTGRYCDTCRKEVCDFTGMEPELVLQVLQQNSGSVCGRMEASKVEYRPELHVPEAVVVQKASGWFGHWFKMAAAAAASLLVLVSGKAQAQEAVKQVQRADSVAGGVDVGKKDKKIVLKGRITDAVSKMEVPLAVVVAKHKGKIIGGARADYDGYFSIQLPQGRYQSVVLEISEVGYDIVVLKDVKLQQDTVVDLSVELTPNQCEVREIDSRDGAEFIGRIQIVDPNNPPGTRTITREQIRRSPYR